MQTMFNTFHIPRNTNNKAPTEHHLQAAKANSSNGEGGCENTAADSEGSKFSSPKVLAFSKGQISNAVTSKRGRRFGVQ